MPADRDPMVYVWSEMAKPLTATAAQFSDSVYKKSSLPLREFEAARIRISQINDCTICQNWRTARDVPGWSDDPDVVPEEFYDNVGTNPGWAGFSVREALAAEFAGRFALDHLGLDDEFWGRFRSNFSDEEIVDLGLCVGAWVAFGRLNKVLDIDGACQIPLNQLKAAATAAV